MLYSLISQYDCVLKVESSRGDYQRTYRGILGGNIKEGLIYRFAIEISHFFYTKSVYL